MNKGIAWGVIGAVVVVGAGAYLMWGRGASAPAPAGVATTTAQAGNLRDLASMPPQQCDFTSANNSAGTVFAANGMVRADFSGDDQGRAVSGHFIMRDGTSYVWMDGMSQGFKNALAATSSAQADNAPVGPDERVTYACRPWAPDEGRFELPASVTFMTASDMQVKAGASAAGASCGQCAQLPEAAKAQCLAALHC